MSKRRHVFISHHHVDDDHVTKLTDLLARNNFEMRNSSIRAKPANEERLKYGRVPERLLRMKISWASTVNVLIGKDTHNRPWVDWEIRKANELGKRIVGVYAWGGTEADVPPAFNDYGNALVSWKFERIIDAIEGKDSSFERPDGQPREAPYAPRRSRC